MSKFIAQVHEIAELVIEYSKKNNINVKELFYMMGAAKDNIEEILMTEWSKKNSTEQINEFRIKNMPTPSREQ